MFSALYLSLPGGQGVCILYARVVFALSTTKKRSYFCRDSDLPSYRFKCLRAACFSSDVDEQNMCGDMCKRTVALSYFIGLRVFCRAYAKYGELTYRRCKILLCTRCDYFV